MLLFTALVGWQLLTFLMEKDEEVGAGYERMRLQRLEIEANPKDKKRPKMI
mgnify:FL=1